MTDKEMISNIKGRLRVSDERIDATIADVISDVCDYCNLPDDDIPDRLETFVWRKVKGIVDYEAAMGTGFRQEIESIREGEGSITWAQTEGNTKASIYGLSESDKKALRRHRRLRGYA